MMQGNLRIRGFELVDEDGHARSLFKIDPDGEMIFRFFDEKGTIRFKAGASEKGSGLLLINNLFFLKNNRFEHLFILH